MSVEINIEDLPRVALEDRNRLPRCSAVYLAISEDGTILYVGQATDIKRRWAKQYHRFAPFTSESISIAWLELNRTDLLTAETTLINQFQPPLNWVGAVTAYCRSQGLPDPKGIKRQLIQANGNRGKFLFHYDRPRQQRKTQSK